MSDEAALAERLEAALEMWEDGVQIMRENLRRRSPHASEQEIEAELSAWLADRPCDADGVAVPWPGPRSRSGASGRG
jgi:hypothetical protein